MYTFILWTFFLYCMHRLAHIIPFLKKYHNDHHRQVFMGNNRSIHWSNLFLYFDTWKSTIDQLLTETIPTLVICAVTGEYWLFFIYYIWAASIQERLEHNINFNMFPLLTSGKWHLIHHKESNKNFGTIVPIWDIIFGTCKGL